MTQSIAAHSCIKVLLVEDNPGDARLVREFLDEASPGGFCVANVDRVSKAEVALAAGDIEVVLLDLTLPDSCGIDTFRKIAQHVDKKRVVVLTGIEDGAIEQQLIAAGAFDYLPKRHLEGKLLSRILRNAVHGAGDKPAIPSK
jgi:DNA-binding NarL/FixJ family response regulator